MKLPTGITGFWRPGRDPIPPSVPVHDFKAACYEFARTHHGTITDFSGTPRIPRTYYYAKLNWDRKDWFILCNTHYPYVALAPSLPDDGRVTFIDNEVFSGFFREHTAFDPLPGNVLNRTPKTEDLSDLSKAEHGEIKHWEPNTIGSIIFNFWD